METRRLHEKRQAILFPDRMEPEFIMYSGPSRLKVREQQPYLFAENVSHPVATFSVLHIQIATTDLASLSKVI